MRTTVHVINHTHWDREWFLTHEYTTAWIPELIDSIAELRQENPNYEYLFDGQSLAIEDLLNTQPGFAEKVTDLVASGALGIGPQYSQPDWRITGGELLYRNLVHGMADVKKHGGATEVAWLVDTFGHISQAPQLMQQAGLTSAYVWRGAPQLTPLLRWRSPDGSEVTAVNLFGGYRNLYGITRTADLAIRRLEAEVSKLEPHYGDIPIPLFDGYDLETEPEDPISFYRANGADLPGGIELIESSPAAYLEAALQHAEDAPVVVGELLSGKYGATFPGSLSSRTYLKVLQADCEHFIHGVAEPLLAVATVMNGRADRADRVARWERELLQNAVHDCICGVSIDQVHERMERSYRRVLAEVGDETTAVLTDLSATLADGQYVMVSSVMPASGTVRVGNEVLSYDAHGVGLWPATAFSAEPRDVPAADLTSTSGAGPVRVAANGTVLIGSGAIRPIVVRADDGDTYSSEPGVLLGEATITDMVVVSASEVDTLLRLTSSVAWDGGSLDAVMDVRVDDGATVELSIDLDSTGTGFVAELPIGTGLQGQIVAGMPFDIVARPIQDTDLLGAELADGLGRVLMGQREVQHVESFPFHDHVAVSTDDGSAIVHARGIRSYRAEPDGTIALTLRRSVEWLAATGLEFRAGDAGPAMYVPGARCERTVHHQLGFSLVDGPATSAVALAACERFKHPPIAFSVEGSDGHAESLPVVSASVPMSSLTVADDVLTGRFYNPSTVPVPLFGSDIAPGEIATRVVPVPSAKEAAASVPSVVVDLGAPFVDRGGRSRSVPDQAKLQLLEDRIAELHRELAELQHGLPDLSGDPYHRQLHRIYIVERESLELELSLELNRRRAADPTAEVSIPDEPDPEIAALGQRLNELRIRRRIYDYVAEILDEPAPA